MIYYPQRLGNDLKQKEDGNMMKQEMAKRIEELDCAQFELMMKDMWDAQDYELDRHYTREIQKLKKALETVEGWGPPLHQKSLKRAWQAPKSEYNSRWGGNQSLKRKEGKHDEEQQAENHEGRYY